MNIAVIFAGGVGKRMGETEKPKQFMEIANKPIIIHTLEIFEKSNNIDAIIVSCLKGWIDYLKQLLEKYNIHKVKYVVEGGTSGQMSIFNGIKVAYEEFPKDPIVLIHDGVRPFIDEDLINKNIENTKERGSSISSVYSTETFMIIDENKTVIEIPDRSKSLIAKAPQTFVLEDIYNIHLRAQSDGIFESIDSATLMKKYNMPLSVVMTDYDNIKITTPKDIALGESIYMRKVLKNI